MCHLERDSLHLMSTMMEDSMKKSGLIADLIAYQLKYDMSKIKISSKRVHLGFGTSNLNLEEDGGMRRRTSVMEVIKHQG